MIEAYTYAISHQDPILYQAQVLHFEHRSSAEFTIFIERFPTLKAKLEHSMDNFYKAWMEDWERNMN